MLRSPNALLYSAVLVIGACELAVLWQTLHPNVSAVYRDYYLERSTTCLDHAVPGTYTFGTSVSFRSGGEAQSKPVRVCGWEGPAGDGLHAVGESSRLHFALPQLTGGLRLTLELVAVDLAGSAGQRVEPVANGASLGIVQVATGTPQSFGLTIPADAVANRDALDLELRYPDAILVSPQDSDLRKRSIKLTAARIERAD